MFPLLASTAFGSGKEMSRLADERIFFFFSTPAAMVRQAERKLGPRATFFLVYEIPFFFTRIPPIRSTRCTFPPRFTHGATLRYRGMMHAISEIVRTDGLRGLARGMHGSILRVMVGSAAQLSSYSSCKAAVLSTGMFEDYIYA